MTHRDDHAAALARIAALERELAEARRSSKARAEQLQQMEQELERSQRELERLERGGASSAASRRDEPAAAQGPPATTAPRVGWWRRNRLYVLVITPLALFFIGAPVARMLYERKAGREEAGRVIEAHIARGEGGGELLVLLSQTEHPNRNFVERTYRLDAVDPQTGRRIVRQVLEDEEEGQRVLPAGRGRLWSCSSRQLQLRSLPQLERIADREQLAQRIAALAPGWHGSPVVDTWRGELFITLQSGEEIAIDPRTLRARPKDASKILWTRQGEMALGAVREAKLAWLPPLAGRARGGELSLPDEFDPSPAQRQALAAIPKIRRFEEDATGTVNSVDLADGSLRFGSVGGGHKEALFHHRWDAPPARAPGSSLVLRGSFLGDYRTRLALRLPGGDLIAVHRPSLADDAPLLFSRISPADGKLRWTLRQPGGTIQLGHRTGELVVVVVRGRNDDDSYGVGVNCKTGKLRWRQPI